jgi:hypothetical protein
VGDKTESHSSTYGNIYIDQVAEHPMMEEAIPHFPVGSVIVREKLTDLLSTKPELLAVMIKRAPGFNPQGGDWEFLTYNGDGTKITSREKTGSCLDCHATQSKTDYTYRYFVPKRNPQTFNRSTLK